MCQTETTPLGITSGKKRNRARFCNEVCRDSFREDRKWGAIYGPNIAVDRWGQQTLCMDREEWSCRMNCCAYCGEQLSINPKPTGPQQRTARLLCVDPHTIDREVHAEACRHVLFKTSAYWDAMTSTNQLDGNVPHASCVAIVYQWLLRE